MIILYFFIITNLYSFILWECLLEVDLHTCDETATEGQTTEVNALTDNVGSHGKRRIGTEILREGQQVVGLNPELESL